MTTMSDILWYNNANGYSQVWLMDQNKIAKRQTVLGEDGKALVVGLPWSVVGVGDFNQNGHADILWHNTDTGHCQIWLMKDHRVTGRPTVVGEDGNPLLVGLPWSIVGVASFSQDGKAGILWHNANTRHIQIWQMDRHQVVKRPMVVGEDGSILAVGVPWHIVGVGDFNGDGKTDILWHNADTSHSQIWQMDGNRVVKRLTVVGEDGNALLVHLPWSVAGTGNFSQDGKTDIVWHNASTHHIQIWQMDGHRVVKRPMIVGEDGKILAVGLPWRIIGTGVFDPSKLANIAGAKIQRFYQRTGGSLGPLGAPAGKVTESNGSTKQDFQLGTVVLNNETGALEAYTYYDVEVKLSAAKCFGTEDPGGTDETYLVMSLISVNPNFGGVDKLVHTMRTQIDNNVTGGKVFFQQQTIGSLHAFPGSGIKIHVAVFDHEHGDADDLRNKINAILEDAANKAAQALAGAAAAGDPRLAGAVGDVTEFEIGGVKPVKILTLGLAGLFADLLADDLVGEHEFYVPAQYIKDIVEQTQFEASFRLHPDVLGSEVQFNWPRNDADEFLFSGGGGSYKVYFTVTPIKSTRPLEPRIPIV